MKAGRLYSFNKDELMANPEVCVYGIVVAAISTSSLTDAMQFFQ
jgi:hypothetical protein